MFEYSFSLNIIVANDINILLDDKTLGAAGQL